ncbi:hypothetical protein EXE52_08105 [Halorubrum sp. CGM4_25_10-8A]|nr:hypothetical protein EXE52_08105 [Halorubrum sp. CGM4_25_10-8A]TKX65922.1 hypothetical protein EXE47_04465 [Halorubrum sp. GN12_10-3_MGM]
MAVNQIGLIVECLRSAGELSLRGEPSLSAADCRRRDSVPIHNCCPDRWTATGRTGRRVVGSLEQSYAHQALSKLREASFRKTP